MTTSSHIGRSIEAVRTIDAVEADRALKVKHRATCVELVQVGRLTEERTHGS